MMARAGRSGVDAWIEQFFRRRDALANPRSPSGAVLDMQRNAAGAPALDRSLVGYSIMPVDDDSAAHNFAHRADERLADHAADLLIWTSLEEVERGALELQRAPVMCGGGGRLARRVRAGDPLPDLAVRRCAGCARPVELLREDKSKVRLERMVDGEGQVRPHILYAYIPMQRRTAMYRRGTGVDLGEPVRAAGELTEFSYMTDWEPVRLSLVDMGERLGLTARQVRSRIESARAKIREKLVGDYAA